MNDIERGSPGEVYLVGAGPGDPELLTLRALRLIRQADVILYDRLVSPEVLALARDDAERVYVGKACRRHFVEQDDINGRLIRYAGSGKRVCRLKGGDPFIFGRGGEELEALASAGVRFEVAPGITAASGCAAYAGIPLTHRDYAHSVIFAAGHRREESELDWAQLSRRNQTLVLYMGLRNLPWISERLQAHGVSGTLPAAIVENGTRGNQRVYEGTIASLPKLVGSLAEGAPVLIIVGEVVKLRHQLGWFSETTQRESAQSGDDQPLPDRTIGA